MKYLLRLPAALIRVNFWMSIRSTPENNQYEYRRHPSRHLCSIHGRHKNTGETRFFRQKSHPRASESVATAFQSAKIDLKTGSYQVSPCQMLEMMPSEKI